MENATRAGGPSGEFEFGPVVSTARDLIRGTKRHAFLLWFLFAIVTGAFGWFFGPDPLARAPTPVWYSIINAFFSGLLALATATFGLTAAAGERVTFGGLFRFMDRLPYLLIVIIPLGVLVTYLENSFSVGVWLLLSLALIPMGFLSYYLIDREMGPGEALVNSYRLVFSNLGEYVKFLLLAIPLVILGVLTLGIGMIWIYPFLIIVPGVMFATAESLQRDYGA